MSTDLLAKHRSLLSALPLLPENSEVFLLAKHSVDSVALEDESKLLVPSSDLVALACFCSFAFEVLNVLFKLISFFGSIVDFSAILRPRPNGGQVEVDHSAFQLF